MQELVRKPFQGTMNIIRFNWPFFCVGFALVIFAFVSAFLTVYPLSAWFYFLSAILLIPILNSLVTSWYIYDASGLYSLHWLDPFLSSNSSIVNINAGFDETSEQLCRRFNPNRFTAMDFYDPSRHTEPSIRRARKLYPEFPGTVRIKSTNINAHINNADHILLIFAAHEIRSESERIEFFRQLKKVVKNGTIIVTEHLRDLPNYLAYNVGAFHFYSKAVWIRTFHAAGLEVKQQFKVNPFVYTFILSNGNPS